MEKFKIWAINTTKERGWGNSRFQKFLENSTQQEFLVSQIPFYYAVQAFPRMLCKLAMNIEDSYDRLLVVENIYEEHGKSNSNHFHTNTYREYLSALGWDGKFNKNPWVDEWINKVLSFPYSASEYAAYLSGIEYLYALISHDIAEHINTLKLHGKQSHYANHSVLDWEHGYELLSVSINLINVQNENLPLNIQSAFTQAQNDFINMYEHLIIPTKKEMSFFNKEKIAFYYSREDSNVESEVLKKYTSNQMNILSIASGGEHIFEYLSSDKNLFLDVIDINPNQLELSKNKLNQLLENNFNDKVLSEQEIGKFEKMFSLLRSFFNEGEISGLKCGMPIETKKLKFIVDILFSNDYLNIVFGEDATKYTVKSFSNHFYSVFVECLSKNETNTLNIFENKSIRNYEGLSSLLIKNYKNHELIWRVNNPKNFSSTINYDIINISNIGDWMSQEDYNDMLIRLKNHLNKNGCIIARKLLGDYNLKEVLENHGFNCENMIDSTNFYTETVVAYKK